MRLLTLITAVAWLAAACTPPPPLPGSPELILNSPQKEEEIGRDAARQVEQQIGLVEDPELLAYMDDIGQRLARHASRADVRYRFHVVDMPEPNAFALPGGYIYLSRGLLALVNDEHELANVIGHEIGHVEARHAAQREAEQARIALLSTLGMVAAAILGGPQGAIAARAAGASIIAAYSREQEHDADRIGQDLAARAGWDPAGMADLLRQLENETRLREGATRLPSFFDSHPSTPDRVALTASRADTLKREQTRSASRKALLERTDNLLLGPNPREGVFRGQRFLHPDLDLTLRFPERWSTVNRHDAVGAVAPGRNAVVWLEMQGLGQDPQRAAAAWAAANRVALRDAEPVRVGRLPAFRALAVRGSGGSAGVLELTWIAYGGRIFRVNGAVPGARYPQYASAFRRTAASFRPLTDADREQIRELRMHVVEAQAGEPLAALSERTGNAWSLEQTAVANSLFTSDRLEEGQLVKVAESRPYVPEPAAAPEPDDDPGGLIPDGTASEPPLPPAELHAGPWMRAAPAREAGRSGE